MSETHDKRVAGVRTWGVSDEGRLRSVYAFHEATRWKPGRETIAECPHRSHEAPAAMCKCGLYAFYSFEEWKRQEGGEAPWMGNFDPRARVVGVISASGRAVFGERGFRAQRMRVEALIAHHTQIPALGGEVSLRPLLEQIAARYGVTVIEPEEIDAFCQIQDLEQVESMVGQKPELTYPPKPYTVRVNYPTPQVSVAFSLPSRKFLEFPTSLPYTSTDPILNAIQAKEAKWRT